MTTDKRSYYLDIFPFNHLPEANIGENFPLGANVTDIRGIRQRGRRVLFNLVQESMGNVTPWSWTEPDSASGLRTRVVFVGNQAGELIIHAQINDEDDMPAAEDNLRVVVQ